MQLKQGQFQRVWGDSALISLAQEIMIALVALADSSLQSPLPRIAVAWGLT